MSLSAADIAAFFDSDMPGYALATFAFGDVAGLFGNNYESALGVAGSAPSFTCATSSLTGQSVVQGTTLTIGGVSYRLREDPQVLAATGRSILPLHEV